MLREYGLVPKTATNVGPTTKIQLFSTPLVKLHKLDINCRRRRPEMFRDFEKNFAKFTEKHLCQSFFLNKVAGLNFVKFLRTSFL